MKFSKVIVITVIILNVLFASAVLFIFYKKGAEPTRLIELWYGTMTVELVALARITNVKRRITDANGTNGNKETVGKD